MGPEKEVVKDTKVEPFVNNKNGKSTGGDSGSEQSRRQFIKNISGMIFGLILNGNKANGKATY